MFKKILILLVLVVAGFAGYVALQPNDFRIARSATMAAPPTTVFAQINDFHAWQAWSPWAKRDPNAKATFEGPAAGKDAVFRWDGNEEVGTGSMTILESKPNELIRIQLHFLKPFENKAIAEFTFKPNGDKTDVAWAMTGTNDNFIGKAMCTIMNMDKMVGGDFENGLASIKQIVEAPPKN